jgi:hypothetical protein
VQAEQIDPFARILVSSYVATSDDARAFLDEYGHPPTSMDKAHRFRSIVQAQVAGSDRFRLHTAHMEAGRVQVSDATTKSSYLIRSKAAVEIEAAFAAPEQAGLFAAPRRVSPNGNPNMLAYRFTHEGMQLWDGPTKQMEGRRRLVPAGDFDFVGFWPYDSTPRPDGGIFNQGADDPWNDLGDLGFGEAGTL